MKRAAVEHGGKSPDIVFADINLDRAVPSVGLGCFNYTGQICHAGTRLLVQRRITDAFTERLAKFGQMLKVGNGLDPGVLAHSNTDEPFCSSVLCAGLAGGGAPKKDSY